MGPTWLPGDAEDIATTWDEQVQAAEDCHNTGATVLHFRVREPKSTSRPTFENHNCLPGRINEAVPKMIMQVGSMISLKTSKRSGARRPVTGQHHDPWAPVLRAANEEHEGLDARVVHDGQTISLLGVHLRGSAGSCS